MSVGLFKSLLKLPSHIKHEGAIFELCIRKSNSKTRDEFEIIYHITDCEDNSAHRSGGAHSTVISVLPVNIKSQKITSDKTGKEYCDKI